MTGNSFLICTYSAGYGHHKVSRAIGEALVDDCPGAQIHIVDPLKYGHPRLNNILTKVYLTLLKRGPFIYRALYTWAEKAEKLGKRNIPGDLFWRLLTGRSFCRRLDSLVEKICPAVIICTHPFTAVAVSRWKARNKSQFPAITGVVTDFTIHPFWAGTNLDGYFVASEEFVPEMARRGVPRDKIWSVGIPVGAEFACSLNKLSVRLKIGIAPHRKTVMVMGGGLGLGQLYEVVEAVGDSNLPVQIIVVAGKNEALQRSLDGLIAGLQTPVKVFGFVDNISELMNASDIIITKPGGVTIAEALAIRLPILVWKPIPGQEEQNASFLAQRNLAHQVNNRSELVEKIKLCPCSQKGDQRELAAWQRNAAVNIAGIVRRRVLRQV